MSEVLKIENLTVTYNQPLFSNLNLELSKGEFTTIMGENGSGKTSLIRTLMGYKKPASGRIKFFNNGGLVDNRKLINQKVGWVLSGTEDYPFGVSIKAYFDQISAFYPTWDSSLVHKLGQKFNLDFSKKLHALSLGENSKLRLIKGLGFKPELLILDELTANLSPESKKVIIEALLEQFSDSNLAVLFISHSEEEAIRLSDKIYDLTKDGLKLRKGA